MAEQNKSRVRYDPLAAALAKVPEERKQQVLRDAAIFVSGMVAAAMAEKKGA